MQKKYKPIKKETYRDKYFTAIVYEYRGNTYEVTYANGNSVCCTTAYIQHRDEQEKIDKMIDNPQPIIENETKPFQEQMDEIWEMLGW